MTQKNTIIVRRCDNKAVNLLSSLVGVEPVTNVKQWDQTPKSISQSSYHGNIQQIYVKYSICNFTEWQLLLYRSKQSVMALLHNAIIIGLLATGHLVALWEEYADIKRVLE